MWALGRVSLVLFVGALALGACARGIVPGSGRPSVVAAENMWGSIAAQLAGGDAHVHSVITNPAADPHAYEPTAADAVAVATAGLVIVNGIDYDPWASHLVAANPTPGRIVLDVGRLLHVAPGENPHRWYDPTDIVAVARALSADLERLDPGHRVAYAGRLAHFLGPGLAAYHRWIARIRRRDAGVPVGASESIFALLAPALGLHLLTPPSFMKAVSEGTELTAGATAQATAQIAAHAIRVWVVNVQNATPAVARLTALARARGIPVVRITETLVPSTATFQAWQVPELEALARALHASTGR